MQIWCDFYFFIITGILISTSSASSWHYESQEHWSGDCQTGQKQSPINLEYSGAILDDYVPFKLINYNAAYNATITNNGHSVLIRLQENGRTPQISGGGLPDVYILEQLHFHWESEHTIDNERLPLEMHLVHYAEKYGNFDNAALYPSGVAVLGVLFHISPDNDEYFEPFLQLVPLIQQNPNGRVESVREPLIASTFVPRDHAGFFRYEGSLTTPSCNEGVIWTIFTSTLPISPEQASQFRKIWTEENSTLELNYRDIQPLNGRDVFLRESPIKMRSEADTLNGPLISYMILLTFAVKCLESFIIQRSC